MNPEDFIQEPNEHETCPDCGNDSVWEDCYACGGEGGTSGEELMMEDPLWYTLDDFRKCDICDGQGGFYICVNAKNHTNN